MLLLPSAKCVYMHHTHNINIRRVSLGEGGRRQKAVERGRGQTRIKNSFAYTIIRASYGGEALACMNIEYEYMYRRTTAAHESHSHTTFRCACRRRNICSMVYVRTCAQKLLSHRTGVNARGAMFRHNNQSTHTHTLNNASTQSTNTHTHIDTQKLCKCAECVVFSPCTLYTCACFNERRRRRHECRLKQRTQNRLCCLRCTLCAQLHANTHNAINNTHSTHTIELMQREREGLIGGGWTTQNSSGARQRPCCSAGFVVKLCCCWAIMATMHDEAPATAKTLYAVLVN